VWIVAPGCVITCFALMYYLTPITWIRFGIWMVIGLVFYFVYGYRNSELAKQEMAKVA
jgi:APA family basic amino acid/polyamine antiporter